MPVDREDPAEPVLVLEGLPLGVDPRHRRGGVERVRGAGDRRHALHPAVAVAVDPDLAAHVRLLPQPVGGRPRIEGLPVQPVLVPEVLERAPESRTAPVVHGEHHEAAGGEVLVGEIRTREVGIRPAAVDLHERRADAAGCDLRREIQEPLDVVAVEAAVGDLARRLDPVPAGRQPGQPLCRAAGRRNTVEIGPFGGGRTDEGETLRTRARGDAAEHPAEVRHPGGRAARRRDRPQVVFAALLVGEEEARAVPGPEGAEPVGGGEGGHGERLFRAALRVEEIEIGDVEIPVLRVLHAEDRKPAAVGRPRRDGGDGADRGGEPAFLAGRGVGKPDVVGPIVRLVPDVGDRPAVRRPGNPEPHLVSRHRTRGELARVAARRRHEPHVLAATRARHHGHRPAIRGPGGGADAREPIGELDGVRIADRSAEEISVPHKRDPAAVRRPGRRTAVEPETRDGRFLGQVEEVDAPAVGALRDGRHPTSVGRDRGGEHAAPRIPVDVLEREGNPSITRSSTPGGAATSGKSEGAESQRLEKASRAGEPARAERKTGRDPGGTRHDDLSCHPFRPEETDTPSKHARQWSAGLRPASRPQAAKLRPRRGNPKRRRRSDVRSPGCRRAVPVGEGAMRRKDALEFRPLRGRCRSETGAPLPCALRAGCRNAVSSPSRATKRTPPCSHPADPASATCASRRTRYCDM